MKNIIKILFLFCAIGFAGNSPIIWSGSCASKAYNLGNNACLSNSSGSGITTLNGLTALTQLFSTGTSGSDFSISSSVDTHTFNLPTASSSVRGALSSTDWSTFNGKQAALSFTAPLSNTSNTVSIPISTSSQDGYLSQTDWSTFNNKAPTASPAFTGVPTAPTAGVGTSTTQLATTAFVLSQGFTGASGSIPTGSSTSLVTTTSASTTFVNALTTSITVTATSAPVLATCALDMTSATAASVATVRVTVNGVTGGSLTESLTTATTQHLTIPNQNLSTSLAAGTYTVNCDFNRASGTGTVTVSAGSVIAVALQGASSNGITSLSGLGLSAGPGSGAQSLTGTLSLAGGGTNASLTAANGAIPYSTASAFALLAAGTAGNLLRSGGAGAPTWTSSTFPASTTINQILYSSAANVISGLATANTGALVTSSAGVPSIASGATANRLLRTNGTTVSFAQANLTTDVTGTLPAANGGTGVTAFASQRVPFGTGSSLTTDANFIYDTANTILSVGGNGTAKINAVNASGSHTALQAYNSSAGNAFQATNVSAYTAALISRQNNATTGASVGFEFGRGTAASPTGALNGDQIGVLAATPDAPSGAAFGYSGSISFVASEDASTTSTGGEIVLATTPNGGNLLPVERFRITNDGLAKFKQGVTIDTSASQPTCDSSHRGTWWVIQGGAGVADVLQICLKDASDNYNWVTK